MKGKVKFINEVKGFGFIKSTESEEDIFVHSSGIVEDISEHDHVEFDLTRGRKGMNAVNVRLVK